MASLQDAEIEAQLREKANSRKPIIPNDQLPRTDVQGAWVGLKLILIQLTQMWFRRTTLRQDIWDRNKLLTKKILLKTKQEPETRFHLGTALDLWAHFTPCFSMAIMELKAQSYLPQELAGMDPDEITESSSEFMASHSLLLLEDLDRVIDLLYLSRNMLATSARIAQDYAYEAKFDKQVLQLVDHCVRMVARGYDSTPGTRTEATFNGIVHSYKRVLTLSLQFLHNLITQNESRKLYLWLDLFCAPANRVLGTTETSSILPYDPEDGHFEDERLPSKENMNKKFRLFYGPFTANSPSIHEEQFMDLASFIKTVAKHLAAALPNAVPGSLGEAIPAKPRDLSYFTNVLDFEKLKLSDMMTTVTIEEAIEEIKIAKRDLVPSWPELHGDYDFESPTRNGPRIVTEVGSVRGEVGDSQDEYDQSEDDGLGDGLDDGEDELESYADDHQPRGSLTDIPLVLGPNEIDALPMIIQSGVFGPRDITMMTSEQRLLQAVRCQLLLTQKPGHYLLRELLIFIAAWDLKEAEFHFRCMMQIIEAMMLHGLIPYAYRTFNEGKDIVSPAQAILLKLLLQIFRSKREKGPPHHPSEEQTTISSLPSTFNPEIVLINFLLNTFRREVIPRTVALIWMQGQIRTGHLPSSSFPMNLWDMERVYEGVYQYIELFSFLNETPAWRVMIVETNFSFELLSLIRVLEDSCPKIPVFPGKKPATFVSPEEGDIQIPSQDVDIEYEDPAPDTKENPKHLPHHLGVERPYEPVPSQPPTSTSPQPAPPTTAPIPTTTTNPIPTLSTQLPPPPPPPPPLHSPTPSPSPTPSHAFTWQNLKKLSVLALSSFAFNSPLVRVQVRELGGLELILACTANDVANPFIREHAMLCIKFLLDGDEVNQGIVRGLFREGGVGKDVERDEDKEEGLEGGEGGLEGMLDGQGRRMELLRLAEEK